MTQTEVEGVTGVTQWVANFITLRNKNLLEPWGFQGQKWPWKPLGPNYLQLCDDENLTKLPALTVGPMWTTLWELAIRYQYLPVWYHNVFVLDFHLYGTVGLLVPVPLYVNMVLVPVQYHKMRDPPSV